jgi:glyoxylase-like metal-dependent hydrolase (beta-lactamase superfamily II)
MKNLFLATLLFAVPACAQVRVADGFSTDWANLKIDSRELAPHLYLLHGSGGNTVASIGIDGALLVDPSFAQVAPKLKDALHEMGMAPVRYVIDTHYHSDHSGGNGAFAKYGAVVIAQENCRKRMTETLHSAFWGSTTLPSLTAELPTLTYDHRLTLEFNGEEVTLFHNQPSHTDGDTIVYFHKANVVHMGDIFVNNLFPYIDVGVGGRVDGYLPVIDEVLGMIDDKTQVVPGHGPVATRQQLRAYREMIQTVRDRVAAGVASGKTLEEIMATHPTREFDAKDATDRVDGDGFTAMVYQSLTGKRSDWHPGKSR